MFEPVIIETKRLRLRPLKPNDADSAFEMWSDVETVRYFSFPPMQSIEEARMRIADKLQSSNDGTCRIFAIELKDSGEVVGDCGLHNGEPKYLRAEIGYCLKRRHLGNGYMTEALGELIEYAFIRVGLRRIEADIHPKNLSSIKVIEQLGFQREGYLRLRWVTGGGEVADSIVYGMVLSDWQKHKSSLSAAKN